MTYSELNDNITYVIKVINKLPTEDRERIQKIIKDNIDKMALKIYAKRDDTKNRECKQSELEAWNEINNVIGNKLDRFKASNKENKTNINEESTGSMENISSRKITIDNFISQPYIKSLEDTGKLQILEYVVSKYKRELTKVLDPEYRVMLKCNKGPIEPFVIYEELELDIRSLQAQAIDEFLNTIALFMIYELSKNITDEELRLESASLRKSFDNTDTKDIYDQIVVNTQSLRFLISIIGTHTIVYLYKNLYEDKGKRFWPYKDNLLETFNMQLKDYNFTVNSIRKARLLGYKIEDENLTITQMYAIQVLKNVIKNKIKKSMM